MFNLNKIKELLFLFIPVSYLIGPALLEIINIFISVLFLFLIITKKDYKYFNNKFTLFFLLWYFYVLINSLFSDNVLLSLESSLFYFRFLLFSLALWHTLENSKSFIRNFCISFLVIFVFVQIDAYIQYFFGKNILGYEFDKLTQDRLSGVFGSEWILGSFISRTLPVLMALIIFSFANSKIFKFLSLILLISSDILVFLAAERSAFFYLLLLTILIVILLKSLKFLRILSFILSIFLIIFISFSSDNSKKRIVDKTYEDLITNEGNLTAFSVQHQVIYQTAFKIFNDNKIFGIGPKMFREVCKIDKYKSYTKDDGTVDGCQSHPHNTYIQLLVETGITGLIPIILLFIYVAKIFVKQFYYLYFKRVFYMSDGLILLYIATFITLWPIIPTGNFFNNYINYIYFLPIGFIMYEQSRIQREN